MLSKTAYAHMNVLYIHLLTPCAFHVEEARDLLVACDEGEGSYATTHNCNSQKSSKETQVSQPHTYIQRPKRSSPLCFVLRPPIIVAIRAHVVCSLPLKETVWLKTCEAPLGRQGFDTTATVDMAVGSAAIARVRVAGMHVSWHERKQVHAGMHHLDAANIAGNSGTEKAAAAATRVVEFE